MRLPVMRKGSVMAYVQVDPEDYKVFKDKYLCYHGWGTKPRALVTINGKQRDMAWWILHPKPGFFVDHINGDALDNRRDNLRSATKSQNARNTGKHGNHTSKYKGVSWFKQDKRKRRWRAVIVVNGEQHHLGYFKTEIEAAEAWNAAARLHHGRFAYQNPV